MKIWRGSYLEKFRNIWKDLGEEGYLSRGSFIGGIVCVSFYWHFMYICVCMYVGGVVGSFFKVVRVEKFCK